MIVKMAIKDQNGKEVDAVGTVCHPGVFPLHFVTYALGAPITIQITREETGP